VTPRAVLVLVPLALAGCSADDPPDVPEPQGSWTRGADLPLSPRTSPQVGWTGHEVLVIGGDIGVPTNPSAEGTPEQEFVADGAAYDPASDTWRPIADEARPGGTRYELTVRRADIGEDGFARDVSFFEFFQEASIQLVMNLHTRGQEWSHHVVARTDIDFVEPVPHRLEPYDVRSWIGHVGTRSFTIQAELRDADRVLARTSVVMVTFDKDTQRPRDMADSQRERLLQELNA